MSDINNNFLDEEYLDEEVDQLTNEVNQDQQTSFVLSEAIKRIEQAKLYETLLKHQLFGANSARPEIIDVVETEIKAFILSRLEILLGIKASAPPNQEVSVFNEEEVQALKAIAGRLMTKTPQGQQPTQPSFNQVQAQQVPAPKVARPVQPTINPVGGQPQVAQPAPKKTSRRKRSDNVSMVAVQRSDGTIVPVEQDYSQVVNPRRPPAAMPSQAQMDQINAQQAASNSGAGGGGDFSRLINLAANQMVQKNQNVKE